MPKLIIIGVLLLLLLTVLSPVVRVVAIIAFVVSAVALVIRAVQRRPLRGWAIAVVGSLVLIPVFSGISGAMYGSESGGGGVNDYSGQAEPPPDNGMRYVVVEVSASVPVAVSVSENDPALIRAAAVPITGSETFTFDMSRDSCVGIHVTSAGYNGNANITVRVREDGDVVAQASDPYGVQDVYYPRGGDGTECGA